MVDFTRKKRTSPESEEGIHVSELITLMEGNPIGGLILKKIGIASMMDDYITIKGSKELFEKQKSINSRFHKEDIRCKIEDAEGDFADEEFRININDVSNSDYLTNLGLESICTKPIYSTQSDFFERFCDMNKYARKLIALKRYDIVKMNIEMLKDLGGRDIILRVLHDKNHNEFYSRAIISTAYNNYDNNIAIVVALLTLHKENLRNDTSYDLTFYEQNESSITMYFESQNKIELKEVGYVTNIVTVSNDEVKREALKFAGVCQIYFKDETNQDNQFLFRTNTVDCDILSIKHNFTADTASDRLSEIDKTAEIHKILYNDILNIFKIKDLDQIKFFIRDKVEKSRTESINKYKDEISKLITISEVNNIIQLLTLFKNIELIADEDLEAKLYIEYLISQSITKRR